MSALHVTCGTCGKEMEAFGYGKDNEENEVSVAYTCANEECKQTGIHVVLRAKAEEDVDAVVALLNVMQASGRLKFKEPSDEFTFTMRPTGEVVTFKSIEIKKGTEVFQI